MERRELTDAQWERLTPLLPPERPHIGRPNKSHRQVLEGILFFHRTGVPWRDVPRERFGSWKTLSSRFYRWEKAGVWARILRQLQAEAHEEEQLDWTLHFVDGSVIRAHQHAAGARGTPAKGGRPMRVRLASGRKRPIISGACADDSTRCCIQT